MVGLEVECSHTDLSKVTRVVLVEVGSVVVLTSGHTTTTGVLSVLSDTSVTVGDVSSELSGLSSSGRHYVVVECATAKSGTLVCTGRFARCALRICGTEKQSQSRTQP